MPITNTSVFVPNDDCPVREIGDGLVIMAPDGSMTHSLEDLGAFIWRQLDGRKNLDALLSAVTAEYAVSREKAATDLQTFLGELLAAGIVEQVS